MAASIFGKTSKFASPARVLWGIKVGVVDAWATTADSALTKSGSTAATIGFPLLTLVLVGAGALLGAVGSGITLRRFLRI